jgi:hypothetical protein
MLHISHRQTTAYHPVSNGAVERLHCRLKDAHRACAAAATWSEELPIVLLGLRAQPREDTGLSLAKLVFGAPIVLPNKFLHGNEFSVDAIGNNLKNTSDAPPFSLSRHNSSVQLLTELPDRLLRAPFIWLRRGGVLPPLHSPYNRPYGILRHGPRSFTIRVGSWDKIVSVIHLKACTEVETTPGSPRRRGRQPGNRPGGPAATKQGSRFQTLVFSPSPSQALPSDGPGTVFLVADRFFARPGRAAPFQSP